MKKTGKNLLEKWRKRKENKLIKFKWSKVDKKNNNTPILKDSEIDDLAEMLLQDYKPNLLKEPTQINYLHFLESYLGATIEFKDIYYEEWESPIFGATSFNVELLKVFDKEDKCLKNIKLNKGTIVIDNYVTKDNKEGLALFTGLHEGGHLWLHSEVYTKNDMQLSLFDQSKINPVVCCREGSIESFGKRKRLVTAKDFREHQADYFASAIAMPKSTFIPLSNEILKLNGINEGRVVTGIDSDHDWFAEVEFPKQISNFYGVSKQAAEIKLRKFGFIIDESTVNVQNAQLKLL